MIIYLLINSNMKISELLNEAEGHEQLFTSCVTPHKHRTEGPALPMAQIRLADADYTPGKAALDRALKATEKFTKTTIPNKKK
jgi:hypothetical protein